MAEFVEVMRQMDRMCKQRHCSDCDLSDTNGCISGYLDNFEFDWFADEAENVEKSVMQWAAEHPEPKLVYPTVMEWQKSVYPKALKPVTPCQLWDCESEIGVDKCYSYTTCEGCAANERIPEDVAKKLGIEPKEWGETINERV